MVFKNMVLAGGQMVMVCAYAKLPSGEDGDGRGQGKSMLKVRAHKRLAARSHGQWLFPLWGERGNASWFPLSRNLHVKKADIADKAFK